MEFSSDEELIICALAENENAFTELVKRYIKPVYSFVYRIVGNKGDAEDITQDIFLSVWKNIRRFDTTKRFKTWIFTIAQNTALNWIKRKKPVLFAQLNSEEEETLLDTMEDPGPLPETLFARADLGRLLARALETLHPQSRVVLLLHYEDGFTFTEIGEIFHESVNTIKSLHRRSLHALKNILERDHAPERPCSL